MPEEVRTPEELRTPREVRTPKGYARLKVCYLLNYADYEFD